ncbi:uncharacterized protein EV420DRAFT_196882 [Desarmillaria tabescens]|uniref:Uncharacterized protein n=1 Tax=Armillaria tabescens TaxID=1929756 RepID=A0AA39TNY1_ARMTA|nr:uncharacterized protein EV420DRAFT_196882 [Desarmillaria tabescens]KAK0461398.1 hypothetical protein EV420DRAFT_196882 [Desarmillaria tabescens]
MASISSVVSAPATSNPVSSIRRKPQFTYRSPPLSDPRSVKPSIFTITPRTTPSGKHNVVGRDALPASTTSTPASKSKKHPMGPPLPLYHPLGPLALSLPPLDPTIFGFPADITVDDDEGRQALGRGKRPVVQAQGAEEEDTKSATSGTGSVAVAPAAAREVKEKASSPRKKRGGGKRKRKDADDADATYPAKRTRQSRAQQMEEGSPMEVANTPISEGISTPEPSLALDGNEDKSKPGRRTTRSRGQPVRRDSNASEATSVSVAASTTLKREKDSIGEDKKSDTEVPDPNGDTAALEADGKRSVRSSSKEEGEISEDT